MILITGGFGFIGSNTVEALLELGETCLLAYHKNSRVPSFLREHVGKRLVIERGDIADIECLFALGEKYQITDIVHLATSLAHTPNGLFEDMRNNILRLSNVLEVGGRWSVRRVSIASTLGVYA